MTEQNPAAVFTDPVGADLRVVPVNAGPDADSYVQIGLLRLDPVRALSLSQVLDRAAFQAGIYNLLAGRKVEGNDTTFPANGRAFDIEEVSV